MLWRTIMQECLRSKILIHLAATTRIVRLNAMGYEMMCAVGRSTFEM